MGDKGSRRRQGDWKSGYKELRVCSTIFVALGLRSLHSRSLLSVQMVRLSCLVACASLVIGSASAKILAGEQHLASRANGNANAGPYGLYNEKCQSVTLRVKAQSDNLQFVGVDDNYSNQSYITSQVLQYTTGMTNWTQAHLPNMSTTPFERTFTIKGLYCKPKQGAKSNSSLIVGVHGVGFDLSYWNFAFAPQYSFIKHAASHGYSTFVYDRIGCGQSEAPRKGGFSVVQAPTEVAILQNILTQLRQSKVVGNKKHDKITLIGHSYGSAQSQAISANYPDLIDGLVLTGFSTNSTGTPSFFLAGTFTPANRVPDLSHLSSRSSIWLGTASSVSDLEQFIDPPYYEEGAAKLGRSSAQPVTLGTLFSISAIAAPANNYTGPVFVQDGSRDLPFCSRNCYLPSPMGAADQAAAVQMLFPATSNFTSSIIPRTGHGIALHPTSSRSWEQILSFISSNSL